MSSPESTSATTGAAITSTLSSTLSTMLNSELPSTTESVINGNQSSSSISPNTFENPFSDIPLDSNFAWLLCSLTCVFLWMIYGSCFHSRVIGYVIGSLLNQYLKRSGLGELRIGKIIFKNY